MSPSSATAAAIATPHDFEDLIAAHRGLIVKVAASYSRSADERADLAQDIALQLWHAWPGYDRARPFATWAYRVALNVAITHRRRERVRGVHEPLAEAHEALVGAGDVAAERDQALALVQRAMQALAPIDRALLLLHLDGVSLRDSGEVLGISAGNVATRLSRIRTQLRRSTGEGGVDHGNR